MQQSPLLEIQKATVGASLELVSVLGDTWELPAHYDAALSEYHAVVRPDGVGVIDRSWRAALRLTGSDHQTFLQGMVSNDVQRLAVGQSCRAAMLDTKGHPFADLYVHNRGDMLLIETDPRTVTRLAETLDRFLIMEDVEIANVSTEWGCLSLAGAGASELMTLADGANAFVVSRPMGEVPNFDLWVPVSQAAEVWQQLFQAGATPIGETAAEMLRVEAGIAVWGRELDESILLPEAAIDAEAISYTKGCYVGQEIIARLNARGHTNRVLRSILFDIDAPMPINGVALHVPDNGPEPGREIGRLTSVVASPHYAGRALALGYVRKEYLEPGTELNAHWTLEDGTVAVAHGIVINPTQ